MILQNKKIKTTTDTKCPIIYLASPYGFSEQQKNLLLPEFVYGIEKLGINVYEPFARNSNVDRSKPYWPWNMANLNFNDIRKADAVFAIINGTPPDEGVMIEIGFAFALGKPIFLFRDDFRVSSDSDIYPLNLMVFGTLPKRKWKQYYYKSINELSNKKKSLMKWLRGWKRAQT
jgi:nucleoside 2-deoxyribosyltransferase